MFPILDYEVGAEKATAIFNASRQVSNIDQCFQNSAVSLSVYKKIEVSWIAEEGRIP